MTPGAELINAFAAALKPFCFVNHSRLCTMDQILQIATDEANAIMNFLPGGASKDAMARGAALYKMGLSTKAFLNLQQAGKQVFRGETTEDTLEMYCKAEMRGFIQAVEAGRLYQQETLHRALEDRLARLQQEADTANQAKSVFLSHVSHELKSPLNTIIAMGEMLRDGHHNNVPQGAEKIVSSGSRLLGMINSLLDVARIETGRIEYEESTVDLQGTLTEVFGMFETQCGKEIHLSLDCAPDVPAHVITDRPKLHQILVNLVSNALKFTQTGNVTVRVTLIDQARLCFQVQDTGQGIAPDEIGGLFTPFYQTPHGKQVAGGTGLGLFISQQFAQVLGGHLTVHSDGEGQGATFTLTLPIQPRRMPQTLGLKLTSAQPPLHITSESKRHSKNRPIILIIDDDLSSLSMLQHILQTTVLNCRVETVIKPTQALDTALDLHPDLILLDVNMPEVNGYMVCERIKAQPSIRHTPIIFLTAQAGLDDKLRGYASGGAAYLTKPFSVDEVTCVIIAHLDLARERAKVAARLKECQRQLARYRKDDERARLLANWQAQLRRDQAQPQAQETNLDQTFCEWLEAERLRRHWSRRLLARLAGVSPASVQRLVKGTLPPSPRMIRAISKALGVSVETIDQIAERKDKRQTRR